MSGPSTAVGAGEQFESGGVAFTLSLITPGIRSQFSDYCKLRAHRQLSAAKRYLDADDWREKAVRLDEELAAGSYDWGTPLGADVAGDGCRASLNTPEGQLRLTALLLAPTHGELDPSQVATIRAGADPVLFAGALKRALGLGPNSPAPDEGAEQAEGRAAK